ncbi:MAG: tetratricopeptide repeat protein [Candidatus Eisenbacteria sp.]|nr:tetratricopeptide repeat protein [Candidatus Eisenbacteria bacterium]
MAPQSDDFTARIAELESELTRDPSPRIFAPLAEAHRLSGRLDTALEIARRGVEAHPDHAGIRIVLARAVVDSGARERALSAYRDVLTLDSGNIEAQAYVDSVPERTEAPVEDVARRDAPDETPAIDPDGFAGACRRPGTGSLSEELAHLTDLFVSVDTNAEGASLAPSNIATLTLAEIYSRQGLYGKAAEVCERILERDPDNESAKSALEEYRKHPATV